MGFSYRNVDEFTPKSGHWSPIGAIASWAQTGNAITLHASAPSGLGILVSFLGPRCFRVRFRALIGADYAAESSPAVIERDLGPVRLKVQDSGDHVLADTGEITVRIDLKPYRIRVFRGRQLISADAPDFNLVYLPAEEAIANFKIMPANARYCGFGSKAGATLFKNQTTMTFFNFDNFCYTRGIIPEGQVGGPLNPSEPLYCSIPLLIEVNPDPVGDFRGAPYAYGLFFDNPSQSYFNIGAINRSDMAGQYYFGALYGEMDYYVMAGGDCGAVLTQYTTLTGRSSMPPKYVFGFHQGAYGYYDHVALSAAAQAYRAARIPIDGLHIDIDFQDNYRNFTHSEMKFPDARRYLDSLHTAGFKCSTDVTAMMTANILDETGNVAAYRALDTVRAAGALQESRLADGSVDPGSSELFRVSLNYGTNLGSNPYSYPPLKPNADGSTPLSADGWYPDFSRASARRVWGDQYRHLIQDLGLDMIWQDMTCPASAANTPEQPCTFPLSLIRNPDGQPPTPHAKIHNLYALHLLMATWDGIQRLRKEVANQRNFVVARGGYAGMQRYAALWTGDTASSWDFLSITIPQMLNHGLSGIPISGCDIGGFANGSESSPGPTLSNGKIQGGVTEADLFTRWTHVGAFLPWFRNHYNAYTKQYQEVYAYGEPVLSNCRKYIELRYRMLQIFYDAMYEWTQTGMPISRALFLNDPTDPRVYDWVDSEFFVGRDMLVAPILTRDWQRQIYLPAGSAWYSFKDNKEKLDPPIAGGGPAFDCIAPLDYVPIYIRAGAILPMRELEQYVGELRNNPLTINIYPGPDSTYQLYQDDGITCDAETERAYRVTEISHQSVPGGISILVRRSHDRFTPPEPFFFVALLDTVHPSSVTISGALVPDVQSSENLAAARSDAYYWNANIGISFIKVFDRASDLTVTALHN